MTYTIRTIKTAHDTMMRFFIKDLAKREDEVRRYGRTNWSPYREVSLDSAEDCHYMAELAECSAMAEYNAIKWLRVWGVLWRYNKRVI